MACNDAQCPVRKRVSRRNHSMRGGRVFESYPEDTKEIRRQLDISGVTARVARFGTSTLIGLVALIVHGCAAEMTTSNPLLKPATTGPAFTTSYESYEGIPCKPQATLACGGFFPVIAPHAGLITPWGIITSFDLGAYAKTWTPSNQTLALSLSGHGTVKRGSRSESFSLSCEAVGSVCGDLWRSYHTCDVQKNDVRGTTHHLAQSGVTLWSGTFSDRTVCFGPTNGGSDGDGCTDPTQLVDDPEYDPNNDGTCGNGSGGDSTGSGTQYYPGDNTGGETVDWSTGTGNGGGSACGAEAVVEYVCIDVWNAETQRWDGWSCGYATTC